MPATPSPSSPPSVSFELRVRGVVQGVGFRPYIHRLAVRHGLSGWVRNEAGMVRIHGRGLKEAVTSFIDELPTLAPPLTRLDSLQVDWEVEACEVEGFVIRKSDTEEPGRLPISPDVALCAACEAELMDPADRRFGFPFITCTDCGPRFTVIEEMPYDRVRTSMRGFTQCWDCLAEYQSPGDRRYHSETNSCPNCGPEIWFEAPGSAPVRGTDEALTLAAALLRSGGVLGLRGMGGFHLAVDATNPDAVDLLRSRKTRPAKPLAVMVGSPEDAERLGTVGPAERRLLASAERPIVLLDLLTDGGLAPGVGPGMGTVGVMVAYTPLHLLLLERVGRPLVMTSGNRSEEPIATANDEARKRLSDIADGLLLHDREIVTRYDDSVVRVVDDAPVFLRRARGFAPLPLRMPFATATPVLAVGPHLKNTFTLADGEAAFVSQHIGDLENLETLQHFRASLDRFRVLFRIEPTCVVADGHPGYLSTRVAQELSETEGLTLLPPVQHHHAHIAAVMAEHGCSEPVIGLAFDGTGWGPDEAVWGGELLLADLVGFRRVGHLDYAPLPGGDLAARRPWRAALGYLVGAESAEEEIAALLRTVPPPEAALALRQIERGINSPSASSMGRLFDAAAAVTGVRTVTQFEGQAPMEMEALADRWEREVDRSSIEVPTVLPDFRSLEDDDGLILDPRPLLQVLGRRARSGVARGALAAGFHDAVVRSAVSAGSALAERWGVSTMVLGGGVFQNRRILGGVRSGLQGLGFRVLVPRLLSPNDGGVSFGQAVVATARLNGLHSVLPSMSPTERN